MYKELLLKTYSRPGIQCMGRGFRSRLWGKGIGCTAYCHHPKLELSRSNEGGCIEPASCQDAEGGMSLIASWPNPGTRYGAAHSPVLLLVRMPSNSSRFSARRCSPSGGGAMGYPSGRCPAYPPGERGYPERVRPSETIARVGKGSFLRVPDGRGLSWTVMMVPVEGIEPPLCRQKQILSLPRLPIPPHRHRCRADRRPARVGAASIAESGLP